MAIGILALCIGLLCIAVSSAGIRNVERPIQKERVINYPYPEEL